MTNSNTNKTFEELLSATKEAATKEAEVVFESSEGNSFAFGAGTAFATSIMSYMVGGVIGTNPTGLNKLVGLATAVVAGGCAAKFIGGEQGWNVAIGCGLVGSQIVGHGMSFCRSSSKQEPVQIQVVSVPDVSAL